MKITSVVYHFVFLCHNGLLKEVAIKNCIFFHLTHSAAVELSLEYLEVHVRKWAWRWADGLALGPGLLWPSDPVVFGQMLRVGSEVGKAVGGHQAHRLFWAQPEVLLYQNKAKHWLKSESFFKCSTLRCGCQKLKIFGYFFRWISN